MGIIQNGLHKGWQMAAFARLRIFLWVAQISIFRFIEIEM